MAKFITVSFVLFALFACSPKSENQDKTSTDLNSNAKMEWWREARFGMFIHWGLYADPAGEWEGKAIPGISEWIMLRAEIPVSEYEKLAGRFNPTKFDAEKWVLTAKNAGMKYIVITSKHHDGFAMFHSKASTYNIYDATPFKRDPLKELSDACKKHNMRLGFYYSQAQDWHEPGGTFQGIDKGTPHWDPTLKRDSLMNYIRQKALPQVKEILENYGGLDILWWDTPIAMTEEAAKLLQHEVEKYPNLITNNRLYRPWPGDFSTPEQHVPPTGLDYDWEVCMTMNTSWGYKWYDNNWKSADDLIRMLVDIASKGGNLLLNVGPTAEGLIPDSSIVRLEQIGKWMKLNGESIYGTSASPFFKLPWGRCTQRVEKGNTTLYLHVFNWPNDQILRIPGLDAKIQDIYLLTNPKQKFAWKFENGDVLIHAPSVIFDAINTVIVVKIKGKPEIESNMPGLKNGIIELPAAFADIHNPGYGTHAAITGSNSEAFITNWVDPKAKVEWMFDVAETGDYVIEASVITTDTCMAEITIGKQTIKSTFNQNKTSFETTRLGEISITETGNLVLTISPVKEYWKAASLQKIKLTKK